MDKEARLKIQELLENGEKNNEEETVESLENFEYYYKYICDDEEKKWFTKEECGYIWLCSLFATFYDSNLELKWGKLLYETIIAIIERNQEKLLNEKYEDYLLCLNLIGTDKLNWGSSIRFCWFDNDEIKNKYINYLKQLGYKDYKKSCEEYDCEKIIKEFLKIARGSED